MLEISNKKSQQKLLRYLRILKTAIGINWQPIACRCHLDQGIQRDVWGDGGRLLLLDEAKLRHFVVVWVKSRNKT